ncbi:hypothetical protein JCM5350_003908 [Sporobolomyces pararoseus]
MASGQSHPEYLEKPSWRYHAPMVRDLVGKGPAGSEDAGYAAPMLVYDQLRTLIPSGRIGFERAKAIAWECAVCTSDISKLLEHGGSDASAYKLIEPYVKFSQSESGRLVREARNKWFELVKKEFREELDKGGAWEKEALEELKKRLVFLQNPNHDYPQVPQSIWLHYEILPDYRQIVAPHFEAPSFHHLLDGEAVPEESVHPLIMILASLTPRGRLNAQAYKDIQTFVRIICDKHKLKSVDKFLDWIEEEHGDVWVVCHRFAMMDGGNGSFLGWNAPINFVQPPPPPAHHLIYRPKSLSHNRYFPQSRLASPSF